MSFDDRKKNDNWIFPLESGFGIGQKVSANLCFVMSIGPKHYFILLLTSSKIERQLELSLSVLNDRLRGKISSNL